MLGVGWSWDARVLGFVAGIPPNIGGGLSTSVAVQAAFVLHLILSKIPK